MHWKQKRKILKRNGMKDLFPPNSYRVKACCTNLTTKFPGKKQAASYIPKFSTEIL